MRHTLLKGSVLAALLSLATGPNALAQVRLPGPSLEAMRAQSEAIAYTYLRRWSSGNAQALADVRALYGPRVSFHGAFVDQHNLFDQKRRFGRRWPLRHYEHRPGTMRVTCEA